MFTPFNCPDCGNHIDKKINVCLNRLCANAFIYCYRCEIFLPHPSNHNSDYVIPPDALVVEPVEVMWAYSDNEATLQKRADILKAHEDVEDILIAEDLNYERTEMTEDSIRSEVEHAGILWDAVEVKSVEDAIQRIDRKILLMVYSRWEDRPVKKSAVVCPDCFNKDTDYIIWGIHKKDEGVFLAIDLGAR